VGEIQRWTFSGPYRTICHCLWSILGSTERHRTSAHPLWFKFIQLCPSRCLAKSKWPWYWTRDIQSKDWHLITHCTRYDIQDESWETSCFWCYVCCNSISFTSTNCVLFGQQCQQWEIICGFCTLDKTAIWKLYTNTRGNNRTQGDDIWKRTNNSLCIQNTICDVCSYLQP